MDSAVAPEQVADDVVKGIADERFLILPHPEVAEYFRRKASDYDRWLRGMRRLAFDAEVTRATKDHEIHEKLDSKFFVLSCVS